MRDKGQNKSAAVMQQRHEPHDSLDFFPTPPWATRALMTHVLKPLDLWRPARLAWDPCCGQGDMARPLAEYFDSVYASDVHPYGFGELMDFLWPGSNPPHAIDWLVMNPPFRLAEQFIQVALYHASEGVAVLARTAFLEGDERWRTLFSVRPPSVIAQFVERVSIVKGQLDPEASRPTAYCWLVWAWPTDWPRFMWIPKCRADLQRPGDYPEPPNDGGGGLFSEAA